MGDSTTRSTHGVQQPSHSHPQSGRLPSSPVCHPLCVCVQMLGDAFQEAGCRVFYSFDDTDKEAAYWAKKNRAYAVITDDTDFLCYEGVDRIWSANIKLPSSECGVLFWD